MKLPTRTLLFTVVLGLVLAGASYARPTWPEELGLDFWSVPALQAAIERDRRREVELEARCEVTLQRIALKQALTTELTAGRLSLRDTAALFRDLDGDRPVYIAVMRWANPGSTDEECYCRAVIRYTEPGNQGDGHGREAARRLEAELECLLATGDVELPDASEAASRLR
jgi:hypothetical protein